MRLRSVVLGCVLVASATCFGQDASATGQVASGRQSDRASAAGPLTVRGCVTAIRDHYTFTQLSTGTMYELQGDNKQFESLNGKVAEITARQFPPATRNGQDQRPRLAVNKINSVGGACPTNPQGTASVPTGAPTTVPNGATAPQPASPDTAATPRYSSPGATSQTPPQQGATPNVQGASGAPSPGTGNTSQQPTPPE